MASTNRFRSFRRLLQASRGAGNTKGGKGADRSPLPCFPLDYQHIGTTENKPLHWSHSSSKSTQLNESRDDTKLCITEPGDFHGYLCKAVTNAQNRVHIATLYIGPGTGHYSAIHQKIPVHTLPSDKPKEMEFLNAISSIPTNVSVKILMDESRGQRPIHFQSGGSSHSEATNTRISSSVNEVYAALHSSQGECGTDNNGSGNEKELDRSVYLFPVIPQSRNSWLQGIVPSTLNELLGVFHLKLYIIDDELIISGANLSEEYFTDRQDQYLLFLNGANGLVDFYSNLIGILADYSNEYHFGLNHLALNEQMDQERKKEKLYQSLSELFTDPTGNGQSNIETWNDSESIETNKDAILYAVPTFQLPEGFSKCNGSQNIQPSLPFQSDSETTESIILASGDMEDSSSIYLSSAYLNPAPSLLSCLQRFLSHSNSTTGTVNLLTASLGSHGFSPKKKDEVVTYKKKEYWIPSAFLQVAKEAASKLSPRGRVYLYHRDGWTFHAKGLWVASNDTKSDTTTLHETGQISHAEKSLLLTIMGSGNFGCRSHYLDVESNCVLLMNPHSTNELGKAKISSALAKNWNAMMKYTKEMNNDDDRGLKDSIISIALNLTRKFM